MKRVLFLFVVLVFIICGWGSTGNACEELRKYPSLYEQFMNNNARGMKELGKLKVIAITPRYDSGRNTYLFVKSEAAGEIDLYLLQKTNKDCTVTDQSFYFDYDEVKEIIRRKGMKKL